MTTRKSPFEIWDFAGWAKHKRDRYAHMAASPEAEKRDRWRVDVWTGILGCIERNDPAGAYGHAKIGLGEGAASTELLYAAANKDFDCGNWHEKNGVQYRGITLAPRNDQPSAKPDMNGRIRAAMRDAARGLIGVGIESLSEESLDSWFGIHVLPALARAHLNLVPSEQLSETALIGELGKLDDAGLEHFAATGRRPIPFGTAPVAGVFLFRAGDYDPASLAWQDADMVIEVDPIHGDVAIRKNRRGPATSSVLELRADLLAAEARVDQLVARANAAEQSRDFAEAKIDQLHREAELGPVTFQTGPLSVLLPTKAERHDGLIDLARALGCGMGTFTLADLADRARDMAGSTYADHSIALNQIHAMLHGFDVPTTPMDVGSLASDETIWRVRLLLETIDAAARSLAFARTGKVPLLPKAPAEPEAEDYAWPTRAEDVAANNLLPEYEDVIRTESQLGAAQLDAIERGAWIKRASRALVVLHQLQALARDPKASMPAAELPDDYDPSDVFAEISEVIERWPAKRVSSAAVADVDSDPRRFLAWVEGFIPGYKPTHHHGTSYVGMALTISDIAKRLDMDPAAVLAEMVSTVCSSMFDVDWRSPSIVGRRVKIAGGLFDKSTGTVAGVGVEVKGTLWVLVKVHDFTDEPMRFLASQLTRITG